MVGELAVSRPIGADTPPTPASRPRGRLARKYGLLFIGLIGIALLVNSGFDFWFSYQENKEGADPHPAGKGGCGGPAHRRVHRRNPAADRLDHRCTMGLRARWTSAASTMSGCCARFRRSPSCRSSTARAEQLRGLAAGDGPDRQQRRFLESPAFVQAKADGLWFSPVYFRKESEPY